MTRREKPRRNDSPAKGSKHPQEAIAAAGPSCRSRVRAVAPPASTRGRAFELLAAQPITLAGLSEAERSTLVVTAVVDDHGNEHPVSRFGDAVWNMAPEAEAKNKSLSAFTIAWPDDVPQALVNDVKAALYSALRRGRHQGRPWRGSAVVRAGYDVGRTLRHIASLGVRDFSQLRALHLSDHIADLRRRLQPLSVRNRLEIIDLVWAFPMDVFHPLPEHPWAGQSLHQACGCRDDDGGAPGRTGKTPVIPRSVQQALFTHCEARLGEAEEQLRARDAGETACSYQQTSIRDAVLYLAQITSGMRNSETTGITSGCWRTEVKNGVSFHWVRTREIKTRRGEVDFLVPPETLRALQILQRYAEPLQARLGDEARWLGDQLQQETGKDGLLANGMTVIEAVQRLKHVREIGRHLFLAVNTKKADHAGTGSRVEVMSVHACNYQLKMLARAAGTDWELANHQCRRTFAYNVANSRLGRMGLVFLKWQLKHASLSWTQLYASNPHQDHALYRGMEDEMAEARVELFESWSMAEAPLSGGAGRKLMQTRTMPAQDIEHLLRQTAESVDLLSTGHAWCISGTRGCHGQGVYDPAMCGGCSQAIIDRSQTVTWQMIHLDNLRLAAITDCGPAIMQKAKRAIERSTRVLVDLGVPLPSKDQAEAYDRDGVLE